MDGVGVGFTLESSDVYAPRPSFNAARSAIVEDTPGRRKRTKHGQGGYLYWRGRSLWIALWFNGREHRHSVARLLGKLPEWCTEDDGRRALELRRRQLQVAGRDPELEARRLTAAALALGNEVRANPVAIPLCPAGPLVYAYFRDDEPLYVGMSSKGLGRPFSPRHHARGESLDGATTLLVWPCANVDDARSLERRAIAALAPPLNQQTYASSEERRIWQEETARGAGHDVLDV